MDPDADTDASRNILEQYLRVASLAIACYVYLSSLPDEWRFYKAQPSFRRMSQACMLFILNRYISIAAIAASNVGFFASFSESACRRYFLVSPSFKVMAALISQVIIGRRTYTLSGRAPWVKWILSILFGVSTVLEWFSNIYQRAPVWDSDDPARQPCISGNEIVKIAWIHYMIAIMYDAVALSIATAYLWRYTFSPGYFMHLIHRMLFEGLGYFAVMTAINVVNLVLYLGAEDTQSAAASLGYALAWVMGQRILVNQFEAVMERKREYEGTESSSVMSAPEGTGQALFRPPFSGKSKGLSAAESMITPFPPMQAMSFGSQNEERNVVVAVGARPHYSTEHQLPNLGVTVHVERAVRVDPPTRALTREQRQTYRMRTGRPTTSPDLLDLAL